MYVVRIGWTARGADEYVIAGVYSDKAKAEARLKEVIDEDLIMDHESDSVDEQDGKYKVNTSWINYTVSIEPIDQVGEVAVEVDLTNLI